LARSQPACSHYDAHAIAHADAQTADPNACACAADFDGYRVPHFYAYSDADGHSDCYPLRYPYSHADNNVDADSQVTDQDALSDAHSLADSCTCGSNGAC
jgi:hypothetical protein